MVRTRHRPSRLSARPCLRVLEPRAVPTTFTVDAVNDEAVDTDGKLSLREAVLAANASGGADSIVFDAGVFAGAQTVTLAATLGEIAVTDPVTVTGPAAALTVDGNKGSRIFNIDDGKTGGIAVNLTGFTLANGSTAGNGGAVLIADESVTLNLMTVRDSFAGGKGGAVYSNLAALKIQFTTLTTNQSTGDGGALYTFKGQVEIDSTTLDNNTSMAGDGGGACFDQSGGFGPVATSVVIKDSTIAKNGGERGGAFKFRDTNSQVANSTVAENDASVQGGGMDVDPAEMVLVSTIVFGNTSPGGDIFVDTGSALVYSFSAVGDITQSPGSTVTDKGGNLPLGTNPLLGPLAFNGGPTRTYELLTGSPAIDAGANPLLLANDQRGPGFPRTRGNGTDMGATEVESSIPSGVGPFGNVPPVVGIYQFTVTYRDADSNIDTTTLDGNDVVVTGPGGFTTAAKFISSSPAAKSVAAVYEITPPGGAWDAADSGAYTVSVNAGQVFDSDVPSPKSVPGRAIGTFKVSIPPTLVVNAVNDEVVDTDGRLSLREAIGLANAFPGANAISFDANVFGTPRTIYLTQGALTVADDVTVNGPGPALVTISGNFTARVFDIAGPAPLSVTLTGLTLSNGAGAIDSAAQALNLANVVITGNRTSGDGGGIRLGAGAGSLSLQNVRVTGNAATGTTSQGGGIFVQGAATVSLTNCTVSKNSAGEDGGGIYFFLNGALTVVSSTISGNKANAAAPGVGGGGIYFYGNTPALVIQNSTVSGNSAGNATGNGYGGGILLNYFSGPLTIQNSTIAFNDAGKAGGGVVTTGTAVTWESTLVAHNTVGLAAVATADLFFGVAAVVNGGNNLIGIQDPATNATFGPTTQTGSLAAPLDPLLDPLANYGGPTETHRLKIGSPAIDAGNNAAALPNDQRGASFPRVVGPSADVGAFESAPPLPPTVTKVAVNGGAAQRSIVTSIQVTFSEAVTFPSGIGVAFQLVRLGPGGPNGPVNLNAVQAGNVVTLTFLPGGPVGLNPGVSLIDGAYQLTIVAAAVQGAAGQLDGDGNGVGGDNFATPALGPGRIHRLFGDNDGDGDVDALDFAAFRSAFGGTSPVFDFDADGDVDAGDFGQFRVRFGTSV